MADYTIHNENFPKNIYDRPNNQSRILKDTDTKLIRQQSIIGRQLNKLSIIYILKKKLIFMKNTLIRM